MMHRFFVEEEKLLPGCTVTLSREESLHAARTLRLRAGEAVELLNGKSLCRAELQRVSEQAVTALVIGALDSPEPPCEITLFQGLPKGDKLETIIQKATELGVWRLVPLEMERCVLRADRQEKKRERYGRIAMEAAKQSGRAHVPEICAAKRLDCLCEAWEAAGGAPYDAVFVAWEEERSLPLSRAAAAFWQDWKGRRAKIAVLIGPEGGITSAERERLSGLGAQSVTLGKRILRTETAGLCALSVIWAALGEM